MLPDLFLQRPVAHRALHDVSDGRPENSRAAIRAAIEAGYGIEIDVQASAGHVPMVFHDYDMARLTGRTGAIGAVSVADLQTTKLTGGDEGIPTLQEVLDLVAGQVPLVIEFKDQDGAMGPDVGPLEHAAAKLIGAYQGPVCVMSFNPHSVAALKEALPEVPRGLVTCAWDSADWPTVPAARCAQLRGMPEAEALGCAFVSHDAGDLVAPRLQELRRKGLSLLTWTIRSAAQEAEARRVVDQVTFEGYLA